jgi:type III secretion protein F
MSSTINTINNGLDLGKMFNAGLDSVAKKGDQIQAKMDEMLNQDKVDQTALMQLQFQIGIYNTMVETLSNVTKNVTDSMKSLAQRTG